MALLNLDVLVTQSHKSPHIISRHRTLLAILTTRILLSNARPGSPPSREFSPGEWEYWWPHAAQVGME